ncbi:MAG: twitching motility protein PilT [Acidimicrobiales bacterium]
MSVVYDAGVLVAADRNDRQVWADHRALLEFGVVPTTTAPVVAQVSRSARQVQLGRLLRGCVIAPFAAEEAHQVGRLLGVSGTADVVDAHVVVAAAARNATVLTSDTDDLRLLSGHLGVPIRIASV